MTERPRLSWALGAIALLFSTAAFAEDDKEDEWTRSYCDDSKPIDLIIIDRTTTHDTVDSKILDDGLYSTIVTSRPGAQIVVRTITDNPFLSERVFDGCRPGCEQSRWSWLTCNSFGLKPEVDKFYRSVVGNLQSVRGDSEAHSRSLIFATIAVATREYRDAQIGRLVVFSDLLENSADLSTQTVLHGSPTIVLETLRSLGLSPLVTGAKVIVYGVGRSDAPSRDGLTVAEFRNLEAIWSKWFREGGAVCVEVYQRFPNSPCRSTSPAED